MSESRWRHEAARRVVAVVTATAALTFVAITLGAVFGDLPAPAWHSRVLLPLLLVAVAGGIRVAVSPPRRIPRGAVVAVFASIGTLAAALYFLIGLHRETACTQEGIADADDERAAAAAHLTDLQLSEWTGFHLDLVTGEMSCNQIGGPDDPIITHRVAVLNIVDHRWPFAPRWL